MIRSGIAYIDGLRLKRALHAGIVHVVQDQERLNKLNVFPVPDGDTGTNLAYTLNAVRNFVAGDVPHHAGKVMMTVADTALDHARGNSGAILAQFLQGLSDQLAELPLFQVDQFAEGLLLGAEYAHEAISDPVEGTILTVVRDFARAFDAASKELGTHDFQPVMHQALTAAEKSLAGTPDLLPVLKKAGVVDAGAQGFVDLVTGIVKFIESGSARDMDIAAPVEIAEPVMTMAGDMSDSKFRYCTECIVTSEFVDRRVLREELNGLGDSLVVAGTRGKVKLHMHVDVPEKLFEIAQRYGTVTGQKADDMQQQQRTTHSARQPCVIITDTAGDVPDDELERLNIHLVPVRIHFGEKSYLDRVTITPEGFYRELQTNPNPVKTSQPPPGDFRRQYQFLGSHYDSVVSIHVSAKASGTFRAAESAAMRTESTGNIVVVDSKNASLGQGLLTIYAAECAQNGYTGDEVVVALDEAIKKTNTWCVLRDLEYSVRGGRVPKSRKVVADFFRLTPIITTMPDGTVGAAGVLLGRRNVVPKFLRYLKKRISPDKNYRLAVGHADCKDDAIALQNGLVKMIPNLHSHYMMRVGTALGAHAGPGGLIVALQEYEPPGRADTGQTSSGGS